jgi:hypothetical protein
MPQLRLDHPVNTNHAPGGFAVHYPPGQYLFPDSDLTPYSPPFQAKGSFEPDGTPLVDLVHPVLLSVPPRVALAGFFPPP